MSAQAEHLYTPRGLDATVALASVKVELSLAKIYEDVRFDEPAEVLSRAMV